MRVVDVHNHLFPVEWIEYLAARQESPRMVRERGAMVFYSHGSTAAHVTNPGHYDPEARIRDLDRCGIDTQMLTLTLPSVEELPVDEGVRWARKINDYFVEVSHRYPGRFYAMATLPLQDPQEAVNEIERLRTEPAVKGIGIFSNVNFKPLASPELDRVFAKTAECSLPVFIHPGIPFTAQMMKEHRIRASLYGFTFDTTVAVMSLIWNGVLERHPGLRIIPSLYRWRIRLRILRWYRALLAVEAELGIPLKAGKRDELISRLDHIEQSVNKMKMPASFADQFYTLRYHIGFVRERLMSIRGAASAAAEEA